MLISWKRYWSDPADGIAGASKQYRELVSEIQAGADALSEHGVEDTLKQHLGGLQDRLVSLSRADDLQKTHGSVLSSVRCYFKDLCSFIRSRDGEVKEIVSMIGDEVAHIASESQQHHERLAGFTEVLRQVGQSRDVREMRRRLTDEVTHMRSYVDGMHEANRATVRTLEQQLLALQDRLNRTEEVAYLDSVTGLPNRRAGEKNLRQAIAAGDSFCALLLDLDAFKQVNDRWGHTCGDQVLEIVGKKLGKVAEDGLFVCRWGGDEFLALQRGDPARAHDCRDTLLQAITGAYTIVAVGRTFQVEIAVSVGIAEHRPGDTEQDLLCRADADLYARKDTQPRPARHP